MVQLSNRVRIGTQSSGTPATINLLYPGRKLGWSIKWHVCHLHPPPRCLRPGSHQGKKCRHVHIDDTVDNDMYMDTSTETLQMKKSGR